MRDTVTVTLTEFLLARIAEDEAAGIQVRGRDQRWARPEQGPPWFCDEQSDHVAVGADRWLAECQAKRRIIDLLTNRYSIDGPTPWEKMASANVETLRVLAAVYADHPHYRDEWRP